MDNRRLLLAVILSMGVLFSWSYFFAPDPPPVEQAAKPEESTENPAPSAQAVSASEEAAQVEQRASAETVADEGAEEAAVETVPVGASREERITIETDLAQIELSNRGAQIVAYRLLDHRQSKDGEVMDLVRKRSDNLYPFGLTGIDGESLALNEVLFEVERRAEKELVFRYSGPQGTAEKHFRFVDGGAFEVSIEVEGRDYGVFMGPGVRNPPAAETSNRFFLRSAVYMSADDFERLSSRKVSPGETVPTGDLAWVGLDDTYFLTVVMPSSPLRQVSVDPVLIDPGLLDPELTDSAVESQRGSLERVLPGMSIPEERKKEPHELALRLMPLGERMELRAYWGSKTYDRLLSFDQGLEQTVNLGIFRPLARFFMLGLQWIYTNVVHNYGWAIILMTLAIKIALLPITLKHGASMKKMQALNPKIQAIRQSWAGKLKDKQGRPNLEAQRKMNEEVMGTYRAAGVNPAGGCLPMLLQIPVFFAFYKILYGSVELRHAPWALWIHDLSAKDPLFILPIVMGASQLIQQRLMPAPAGNPMQRRMMAMMPVVFTFFFMKFPAGLVIYWLTSNLATIIQQTVYNRLRKTDSPQEPSGKKAHNKGAKA